MKYTCVKNRSSAIRFWKRYMRSNSAKHLYRGTDLCLYRYTIGEPQELPHSQTAQQQPREEELKNRDTNTHIHTQNQTGWILGNNVLNNARLAISEGHQWERIKSEKDLIVKLHILHTYWGWKVNHLISLWEKLKMFEWVLSLL